MEVLSLGHHLLLAAVLTGLVFLLALTGILSRERRLVLGARVGLYAVFVIIAGSAGCLVHGFVNGAYDCKYIFNYSERLLPFFFKFAGLWAGLEGSLLFWTLLVALFGALAALQHHWSGNHPTGRRIEPYVYLVFSVVIGFFALVTWQFNPFQGFDPDPAKALQDRLHMANVRGIAMDDAGHLLDGSGLNPQLVNYWFVIHPPNLYLGFVGFTAPFAFTIAALLAGQVGDYWIRIVRRWTMVAWLFLTNGVILGGLWAYRQLGWGGYWAWDPVENASFLSWLTGTAFLHSIMIQERRDMLKGWNVFLIILTFFMTIVGTWMTRSGVVESIHAFAGGDTIGLWFQFFLFFLAGASLFIFFFRFRELTGTDRIESLFSREAAFYLNNLVLLVIATAVFFLSFFRKISHDWFATSMTDLGIFNIVITPLFAALLFLTAVGPGLGWVKTSRMSIRKNILVPASASLLFTAAVYALLGARGQLGTWKEVIGLRWKDQHQAALYPTGLFIFLGFFILATVFSEFYRGLKSRVKFHGEGIVTGFLNLLLRNNRRYGGYIVHIGIAVLTFGIIGSSMFKVYEKMTLRIGQSGRVGPYLVTPVSEKRTDPQPGEPYEKDEVVFRVTRAPPRVLPVAHGETPAVEVESRAPPGEAEEIVTELHVERRFYPKKKDEGFMSEVSIDRRLLEDVYIYFPARNLDGSMVVEVYLNPLMMLVFLGWFTLIAGGLFAALPIAGSRVGLSE